MNLQNKTTSLPLPNANQRTDKSLAERGLFIMETWKSIKGYEGLYEINILGVVKSLKRNIIKKPLLDRGYLKYYLYNGSKYRYEYAHRLIAIAFIPNPNDYPVINHKNGDRSDNRIDNIEWCTQSWNIEHGYKILGRKCYLLGKKGIKSIFSVKVSQYSLNGVYLKTWDCIADAERELNMPRGKIGMCCVGSRKTTGGFTWKYV